MEWTKKNIKVNYFTRLEWMKFLGRDGMYFPFGQTRFTINKAIMLCEVLQYRSGQMSDNVSYCNFHFPSTYNHDSK